MSGSDGRSTINALLDARKVPRAIGSDVRVLPVAMTRPITEHLDTPTTAPARPVSAADAWAVADPTTCAVCGRDACEDHVPAKHVSSAALTTARVGFQPAADVARTPPPLEIVENAAWADNLTVLVSESGTGKTFLLLSMAAAISDGVSWLRREVLPGSVAYASYEGDALGVRLRALREVGGCQLEHVYVLRARDPISPRSGRDGEEQRSVGELQVTADLEALGETLRAARKPPIRLLVIDTVRASMTGSEDGSDHVSAYLRAVRRIMACVPGAAAILAHHAGWQDGETQRKRERGSSAWRGNVDGTLYLEAGTYDATSGEAELTLITKKGRDIEIPPPLHCIRRRVALNEMGRRGQPVTSCVIEPDRRTREDRAAEAAAAAEQENLAVDVRVLTAIAEHPEATSQDRLRLLLTLRKDTVNASLARLLRLKWVRMPEKQRQPYTVTAEGRKALDVPTAEVSS